MTEYGAGRVYLGCALQIAFLVLGLLQLAAAMAEMESAWNVPGWIAVVISVLLMMFLPVVLPFLSFFGAKDAWGWEWWQALLFAAPFLVVGAIVMLGGGITSLFARRR